MLRVTEARMRELWATCAASEHRRLVEPQAKSFDTKQRAALERVLYGDAGRGKRSRAVVATLDGTDRVLPEPDAKKLARGTKRLAALHTQAEEAKRHALEREKELERARTLSRLPVDALDVIAPLSLARDMTAFAQALEKHDAAMAPLEGVAARATKRAASLYRQRDLKKQADKARNIAAAFGAQ